MRALFHLTVIVPISVLVFFSFLIAMAYGSIREAASFKVPAPLNTGEEARRRLRRI